MDKISSIETVKCSACNINYERQLLRFNGRGDAIYLSVGIQTRGNKCAQCFNKAKHRTRKLPAHHRLTQTRLKRGDGTLRVAKGEKVRNCPHCNMLTVNRYACSTCWNSQPKLQYQDAPGFTNQEMARISRYTVDRLNAKDLSALDTMDAYKKAEKEMKYAK